MCNYSDAEIGRIHLKSIIYVFEKWPNQDVYCSTYRCDYERLLHSLSDAVIVNRREYIQMKNHLIESERFDFNFYNQLEQAVIGLFLRKLSM